MKTEMEQFEEDLLQSIREMKAGNFARTTVVNIADVTRARENAGFSQAKFAKLLGISVRTLQEWEQGRRKPSGAAQTLLKIALIQPEVLHMVSD
ncbi:MAG: helix-turn-helix domain-containing protein [Pelistega sp.]|nr:helix-turn-helix domain-containing protein [Pelistega sp.]